MHFRADVTILDAALLTSTPLPFPPPSSPQAHYPQPAVKFDGHGLKGILVSSVVGADV